MIRWSHAALNCRDLDATEEFYRRHFGFTRSNDFKVDDTRIVFIRLGEEYLELFATPDTTGQERGQAENDGSARVGTVRHLAFQVDDVDGFLAGLGPDAEVSLGPLDFHAFIPGWRSVWIRDPDGIIVEVSQGYHEH